MQKIPALDGVRGTALLMVFACHSRTLTLNGGAIGVDVFFVLSGFLITSILLQEFRSTGSLNFINFYMRRALRLFPALYAFTAIVLLYAALFDRGRLADAASNAVWVFFYVFNWLRVKALPSSDGIYPDYGHLWSLSVEEQFYIVWPLVLFLALRSKNPERNFGWVLAIGIVGPALARLVIYDPKVFLDGYFRTDLRFDSLMWGALGAWLYITDRLSILKQIKALPTWATLAAFAVLFIGTFNVVNSGFLMRGGYTLLGFLTMFVIVCVSAGLGPVPLQRFMESSFMRWTGKISYGLYIVHVPVFYMAYKLPLPQFLQSWTAVLLAYLIAGLSFRYYETPFLRMKENFGHGQTAITVRSPG